MLEQLNNERKNIVEDIKLQAASKALREAADQLEGRLIPVRASHEEYVQKNHEEDMKELCMLALAAGLSAAAIIAMIILISKLIRKGKNSAEEKIDELKQELEARIDKA